MQKVNKQNAQIQALAYKKIIYHCLRYSSHKVYGALISKRSTPYKIIDAFPLFHSPLVNPTLGVALDLIQSNIPNDSSIIGLYEFIETGDSSINRIIDTNPILKGMKSLRLWTDNQSQIKLGLAGYNLQHPLFSSIKSQLLKGQHHYIVDFDAHFQEIDLDFTNKYVK